MSIVAVTVLALVIGGHTSSGGTRSDQAARATARPLRPASPHTTHPNPSTPRDGFPRVPHGERSWGYVVVMEVGRPENRRLRIGLVGTFPPRPCGLATFTADMGAALRGAGHVVDVVALIDDDDDPVDPLVAHRLIRHDVQSSREVAAALSATVDVVLIEHEFGIFGGPDGRLLHELTDGLRVPYALTLHTVTGQFTAGQRAALDRPMERARAVLVFSEDAAELLRAAAPSWGDRRCRVVPHGAPAELYAPPAPGVRAGLGLTPSDLVITTFGLLSPGKGIEHAIAAAGALRHVSDDVVYVVAGRTHPEVVRRRGERYREQLQAQVLELGLEDVVVFRNWFHGVDELAALLASSDVFLTPYSDAEQIVSGALSFAIAAGVPFVSTPYRYARELAARGCGLLVPFADPDSMAAALKEVLTDQTLRRRLSAQARVAGAGMSWPEVGRRTAAVLADIVCRA